MKKLIFVNRYFYPDHSATSQMLTDLAFGLAEKGDYDIHVVACRQRYDDPRAGLPPRERINGVEIHRAWTSTFGRKNLLGRAFDYLSFYLTAFFKLLALADRQTVIVAKTDPPLISVVAAVAAKLKSAALINWIQDLFPEVAAALGVPLAKGPVYGVLRRLRNFSLNAAKANVVIGDLMRERLLENGIPAEKIQVVHNWADGDQIKPIAPHDNPLRKDWGLEGKFVVGYSGNFGRGHDFTTILDVATRLKSNRDMVFLLIGGGANLDWVKNQVASRELENILFKPYQPREKLAESLSAADVHLVTLKPELEGLIVPSKLYGIMAAGRPAIYFGSPVGEVTRILLQSQCGFAVEPGDGGETEATLRRLADDTVTTARLGANARRRFDRDFDEARATEQWRCVFQALT